jgi:Rieske Fe-S protein
MPLSQYPKLQSVGGSVNVNASGYSDPICHSSAILVIQPTSGTFVAFSGSCTHDCCPLAYLLSSKAIFCPCTNTQYDLTGAVIGGPSGPPLQKLPACADSSAVYVTIS